MSVDQVYHHVMLPEALLGAAGEPETLDRMTAFRVTVEASQGQEVWSGEWSRTFIVPTAKGAAAPEVAWAWHALASDVRQWVEDQQRNMAVPDASPEWPMWMRHAAADIFLGWLSAGLRSGGTLGEPADMALGGDEIFQVLAKVGYAPETVKALPDRTHEHRMRVSTAIVQTDLPDRLLAGTLKCALFPWMMPIPQPLPVYLLLVRQNDPDELYSTFRGLVELARYTNLRETP